MSVSKKLPNGYYNGYLKAWWRRDYVFPCTLEVNSDSIFIYSDERSLDGCRSKRFAEDNKSFQYCYVVFSDTYIKDFKHTSTYKIGEL